MASAPIETTGLSSNVGRNVTPPLVLFQTPPAAGATKSVLRRERDAGDVGDAAFEVTAGPTLRHRMPAMVAESTPWAAARVGAASQRRDEERMSGASHSGCESRAYDVVPNCCYERELASVETGMADVGGRMSDNANRLPARIPSAIGSQLSHI